MGGNLPPVIPINQWHWWGLDYLIPSSSCLPVQCWSLLCFEGEKQTAILHCLTSLPPTSYTPVNKSRMISSPAVSLPTSQDNQVLTLCWLSLSHLPAYPAGHYSSKQPSVSTS